MGRGGGRGGRDPRRSHDRRGGAARSGARLCAALLLDLGANLGLQNSQAELPADTTDDVDIRQLFSVHEHGRRLSKLQHEVSNATRSIEWLWLEQTGDRQAAAHLESTYRIEKQLADGTRLAAGTGTAVLFRSDKFLITCEHVVRDSVLVIVHPSHGEPLTYATTDFAVINASLDVAVLRAPRLPFAHFNLYRDGLQLGCALHALGYPLDYTERMAIYSPCSLGGVRNRGTPQMPIETFVLTGGGINPGYSGGPLILRRPNDATVWLLGIIMRAPNRFGGLAATLSSLATVPNEVGQLAKLIEAASFVGITEVLSHNHLFEILTKLSN